MANDKVKATEVLVPEVVNTPAVTHAVAGGKIAELMISYENLDDVPEEEKFDMFLRKSQAESADKSETYIGKKLVATKITPYTKDVVDLETGEQGVAVYVAFALEDGRSFKTVASRAVGFAKDIVSFVGVNPKTGVLKHPVEFEIKMEAGKDPRTGQVRNLYAFKALRVIK